MAITITKTGYVKRIPVATYRQQKRGGIGVAGMDLKEEDEVEHLFITSTHHFLLFFTSVGKVYRLKVHELPLAGRNAKRQAHRQPACRCARTRRSARSSTRATSTSAKASTSSSPPASGIVKKTLFGCYNTPLKCDGIIAIDIRDADELHRRAPHLRRRRRLMISRLGQAIRFHESDVRPMGRNASAACAA